MISANCAISGCHITGTGRTVLISYNDIKSIVDNGQLEQHVIKSKDMPPAGPLSNCDIKKLERWIEMGALNN